jgi:hypothetical protein
MRTKLILCTLILVLAAATNVSAGNGRDAGDTIVDVVKALAGRSKAPKIGGNATVKATIRGVGGIVNVGVGIGGGIDAKQSVASIITGDIKGNADVEVTIAGVGAIVNVGVAVGGATVTCQTVGTIGGGC